MLDLNELKESFRNYIKDDYDDALWYFGVTGGNYRSILRELLKPKNERKRRKEVDVPSLNYKIKEITSYQNGRIPLLKIIIKSNGESDIIIKEDFENHFETCFPNSLDRRNFNVSYKKGVVYIDCEDNSFRIENLAFLSVYPLILEKYSKN